MQINLHRTWELTMQIRSKRELYMIISAVVIAVVLLLWNTLFPANRTRVQTTQLSYAEATQKTEVAQRTLRRMRDEETEMLPRSAEYAYTQSAEELGPLITQKLVKTADASGVHLREIKPLRARTLASGTITRVPFEVHFRALFQPDVVRFLYRIEDPAEKMVVDKMDITSADSRFKSVDVSAQISVYTRNNAGGGNTN